MSLHAGEPNQAAYLGLSVLLTGPDAGALRQAARELAMGGLCATRLRQPACRTGRGYGGLACQQCPACRQVEKGIHPDFIILGEEDDVSIKALRGLLEVISRKSPGGRRMIILEAVERLNIPAVNALLKTLEEPAADTRFILTTQYPGRLPVTLRSRCQVVRVTPAPSQSPPPAGGENEIAAIARELGELLRKEGPSPSLRRAFLRLRDYYRIKASHGNTKLARDVLRYSYEPGKRL